MTTFLGPAAGDRPLTDMIRRSRPRRPRMRDVVAFRQQWRHRRSGGLYEIVQIHRVEKCVEARSEDGRRLLIRFRDLANDYELLVSFEGSR